MEANHKSDKLKRLEGHPVAVPFQGIGTRLRRSLSKDHSNEFDNLSSMAPIEIANLRHHSISRNNAYDYSFGYPTKSGTLERPKRLNSFANTSESGSFGQQPLYGTRNLYEESRLLGHQYEEPQLVMERDALYETNQVYGRRRSKDAYLVNGGGKHLVASRVPPMPTDRPGDIASAYHSYMTLEAPDRSTMSRPNTTVIPPSKLFSKNLSTSYNTQSTNGRHDSRETTGGLGTLEYSPKSQNSSSVSSFKKKSNSINRPKELGGNESDSSTTKADSGLTSSSDPRDHASGHRSENGHHHGTMSTDRTFNDQDTDPAVDSPPKLCLTSSSQSSVMHTYANPFQSGCGGSTFSEDTTGPIIPDMNTLRPPQLLKNSFAGSGPPPNLHHPASSSANRTSSVISHLNRLWSSVGVGKGSPHDQKAVDVAEHRCTWRMSTFLLLFLLFASFIIIILLSAMGSSPSQSMSESSKVPCIVVEDLDSTSSSHLSSIASSNYEQSDYLPADHSAPQRMPPSCPLPRDPHQFKEIRLLQSAIGQTPVSFRLAPLTTWTVNIRLRESSNVNFHFLAPMALALHARLVLIAAKNEPPSLSQHQIYQVIRFEGAVSGNIGQLQQRTARDLQLLPLQSTHYLETGVWYITLVNDDREKTLPLVGNISVMSNQVTECSSDCHKHGHCHMGRCQCFPGFLGHDCAENVCPVFCSGHGQYLQGSCRCEAGWKGRECSTRVDECEVADCNGNGLCIDGFCKCRPSFKGEHCEMADCLDPQCSGHGVCFEGVCFCKAGWSGGICSLPDSKLHQFLPNCSNNGVYDFESGQCVCHEHYSGVDCASLRCNLNCGLYGFCKNPLGQEGQCQCADGWSGPLCDQRQCDSRCLENGKCVNGTCHCKEGWMGKYCTLDGCPNLCSKHGRCVSISSKQQDLNLGYGSHGGYRCQCTDGWGGPDCSVPQEINCADEIDNDNDGLVDCADSECCRHELCQQSLMCITSPDPLDILLRKQPPSPISSFFQKVQFLIEDGSVQSYALKEAYSEKRVSVIRGQVVGKDYNGLIGVRVSATDPQFGFTLTRSDGWFDILVNGGGIVELQFQRNPFYPIKKFIYVSWNDIAVVQSPIVMFSVPDNIAGTDILNLNHRAFSFYSQFSLPDLGEIHWSTQKWANANTSNCPKHDYEHMKPSIRDAESDDLGLTKNTGVMCGSEESCILAESQTVHEKIPIGGSDLKIVYQSSMAQGYLSTLFIQLTPSSIPVGLRFVFVRIVIEGSVTEKMFEAEPELLYTFSWNKRNIYKQKCFGHADTKVFVGYIYHGCSSVIWTALQAKMKGFEMDISDLGAWNLDIHHRYNLYDGIFQRGEGQNVYFQGDGHGMGKTAVPLSLEPIAGSHMQARPFTCSSGAECGASLSTVRFFALTSLDVSPDGSLYIGDANLIRRITVDGRVQSVYTFKLSDPNSGAQNGRQTFEYYVAYNSLDNCLYISDPDRLQIVRVQITDKQSETPLDGTVNMPDVEVVIGTGERCLPHDRNQCGDGRAALDVQLLHPRALAFGMDGTLFFADGSTLRAMDTNGFVHRIAGDWNKRQWKPTSCQTTRPASEIKLHWPLSLAVNPTDGTLYFVDNYIIFKLNHELQVTIVAGLPSYCLEEADASVTQRRNGSHETCQSGRIDPRLFSYCGEDILFGSITFTPRGVLYASDISRQAENRIFALHSDGSLVHVAGFKSNFSPQQHGAGFNCSVERCSDMGGQNCTCLISESGLPDYISSPLTERTLALKGKLFSISGLAATGDGTIYLADEGSLRLYRLQAYSPQVDDQLEIKIISPNRGEIYTFNQHGQHVNTRSTVSGRTLFTFHYNQNNSFGKLSDVIDVAGNKLSFIRDPSGSLHTIDSSTGFKAYTLLNKLGLLEQINTPNNGSIFLDYYTLTGLLRSKLDSSTGAMHYYQYDANGRATGHISPSGIVTSLNATFSNLDRLIVSSSESSPFREEIQHFYLSISPTSHLRLMKRDQSIDMNVPVDGSFLVNSSSGVSAFFTGQMSKLAEAMLPMQAHMFPLISKCRIEHSASRGETATSQAFDLSDDLKMKSSIIASVQKDILVNSSLVLKIEQDWNANRVIHYNQSQRPILYLQFDEYGRPIQWVPNIPGLWIAHSLSFEKDGLLSSWQEGGHMFSYIRDRAGRLLEVRQKDHFIRYSYGSEAAPGNSLHLPSSMTLRSGHKYLFELDPSGRVCAIVTPKGSRHELNIKIMFGYRFAYCPPIFESKPQLHSMAHCHLIYFDESRRPLMKVLPYEHGKIVFRYAQKASLAKEFAKDLHRSDEQLIDQTIFGNGLVERWYDRSSGNDLKGIWRSGVAEFVVFLKYTRISGQLKHQSYQFSNIPSVSQLIYNYRYDSMMRLRAIQCKLGAINLPVQEFAYNKKGQIEMIGNFRYFERSANETLVGDGVALFVRRYESTRGKILYSSVTIADKEVFRVGYTYDSMGMLVQTRSFMRHIAANKMRMQNYSYDSNYQLSEVSNSNSVEKIRWKFVYDFNGNLITFLYLGNRIDVNFDAADRVRNFGKGPEHSVSSQAASSPYITDLRGFVVQRGDEVLTYNHLGQLLSARQSKRYEVNYTYDYRNRLVVRRDHQNNVTQYFYGNPRKPNLVTHALNNADGRVLSLLYDDHDDSLLMLRVNNEKFYVASDQTQSPLLVFDHRGNVIKEIHRSPYGHILFDSNPGFYLPVDFQGGIPDPLTNLVHFPSGRVYDTLTGRWMTPQVESLLSTNLIEHPQMIHLYLFNFNDPINIPGNNQLNSDIVSPSEAVEKLQSLTSSLIEGDLNLSHQPLLSQLKASLSLAFDHHSPLRSHFFTSLEYIIDELRQFASMKMSNFFKLTQQDWTSSRSMWSLISMENGFFGAVGGVLIAKSPASEPDDDGTGKQLQVFAHSRADKALIEFLNKVINGSSLVDVHQVMGGQDHFYLVHDNLMNSQSLAQLNKFQHVTNFTVQKGQGDDKKPFIDIRLSLDTVIINIRFGSTVTKEHERVLRLAKKFALSQRLSQERIAILHSRSTPTSSSSSSWSEEEKKFILSTDRNQQSYSPLKADYYHEASMCSQLADDASNIVLKSKRSN